MMSVNMRWRLLVLILPLVLAAAQAAAAGSTTTNFRRQGDRVTALFEAPTSLDGCAVTLVFIDSADLIEKVSGASTTPMPSAMMIVIQANVCQEPPVVFFDAVQATSNTILQVSGNFTAASVTGSVTVFDLISQELHTLQLNLTWQAITKPEFTNSKETFEDPEVGLKIKT